MPIVERDAYQVFRVGDVVHLGPIGTFAILDETIEFLSLGAEDLGPKVG